MNPPLPMGSVIPTRDRDSQLADILQDLLQIQQRGEIPDLAVIDRDFPDLAQEVRELWATAQFAQAFVRPLTPSPASSPTEPFTDSGVRNVLPRDFGDYQLLEELGRGGMGVVYKARQKSLNRFVALKMVRDADLASPIDQARFLGEAQSVARLKHPNIVTVFEVGECDGHAFFAMELIEGETLAQRIARHPLPPGEAATLVATIARAVQHAHEQGILHRDLKPSNILLGLEKKIARNGDSQPASITAHCVPYVTDFGLAKRVENASSSPNEWRTQTGAIVGTPGYMPPEQAGNRGILGPTADVYALGAILYECLTGRPPFQAATPVDTLLMVLEQEPVPPRWLNPKVDRDLELICLKCLQKPSEMRYPTASDLANDLEAFAKGETLSTQPSGLRHLVSRLLRPTHHATVLQNWGVLWMWHSLQVFLLCLFTQMLDNSGVKNHWAFLVLWSVGLITWGVILWRLRRRAGPVLFVERQIAHAWAAGVCASIAMFVIEVLLDLPALKLSPVIAVAAGMVFVFKAGILSGEFYLAAASMFLTAVLMPFCPEWNIAFFGLVLAICFFIPGLKYYRQRLETVRRENQSQFA
ncbi:serine/threonine-protein kinase [Tuwongella immobilis]|uniref:Protein kinase domain-containing protein n=1 Tax=Tuwongella immobilis TaxID=692036 RepID=A0A6C2YKW0_9BACT|nr:serine/threonine-protein kinase [Tuwongella immobilis]VIP01869.1 serine threonine protein kinase : Serine/threonine protein kinase-related protein OS=Planctomyces limnophilus (strain ATCC 43296 / DSM 3776 / IFAM 1008 / 290) GN=Plim_4000 PE=3 SV=1: Pkinase [Tuwongella immobilis]VTR99695.1 serine threonine protein kinase : Serine/threonine protein kinase-related protein OS=Planctomyces limnophilus (strain ATCC 43296 / DSM 3776 / IFAM 1008 / 290) GN=Plim_4000 PE=3 SV=1: Pkinase [Tuwongella immobi